MKEKISVLLETFKEIDPLNHSYMDVMILDNWALNAYDVLKELLKDHEND